MNSISTTLALQLYNTEYPHKTEYPHNNVKFNTWLTNQYGFCIISNDTKGNCMINITNKHKKLLFDLKYL